MGVLVGGGADGNGSAGVSGLTLDLSDATYLEMQLAVGPANQMSKVELVLKDADGTEVKWTLSLSGVQPQVPKTYRLVLDKPDANGEPGSVTGFNKASVASWEVRGDGVADSLAQVLLMQLRAGH